MSALSGHLHGNFWIFASGCDAEWDHRWPLHHHEAVGRGRHGAGVSGAGH